MQKHASFASAVLALLSLLALPASAQLQLPRPSPGAKISQTVGLTEISVDYSSPAVRGRKIWGAVVPYGEVWRAGANQTTKVTFSKDATIGGTAIPAGSYAFFAIPGPADWTLILNKDFNQGGAANYKQELDLVRVQVRPKEVPFRERLAYLVSDFTENTASLDLEWEKVRVSLPIRLNTDAQALANIKAMTESSWSPYNNAARYMLETKKDYDAGLQLVDKSISIKEEWFNVWTKAQLLAAKGKRREALALAEKARKLGAQNPSQFFLASEVDKAIQEWKGTS
jgi:hypothetical protein